jgi:dimethylhistidine N-methyltransferase
MELDHQPRPDVALLAFDDMRTELAAGLIQKQAQISPKYFYNELGSKIFEAICHLDEYYLTRCEASIFEKFSMEIQEAAGTGVTMIDLGAGNCMKAAGLFDILQPRQYVPVDISVAFLQKAVAVLQAKHPDIPMHPVAMDFSEGMHLPPQVRQDRRLFFYPGSSLGNLTPLRALKFLQRIRNSCDTAGDALLIGIDLVKGRERLEAAYDDALGVTAAFNRNILLHVNEILGSNFDPKDWQHRALFNHEQSRIEMHLRASNDVTVQWDGGSRHFEAGEYIHTENSYKYSKQQFAGVLAQAGFGDVHFWSDEQNSFLVCYARAV